MTCLDTAGAESRLQGACCVPTDVPIVCTCSRDTCTIPCRKSCCCEQFCTCRNRLRRKEAPRTREQDQSGTSGTGRCTSRRCSYCLPERTVLEEVALLDRQRKYHIARASQWKKRASLTAHIHPLTCSHSGYRSNTAQLLRCSKGTLYRRALEREQRDRRQELQMELAARREEIAGYQCESERLRLMCANSTHSASASRCRRNRDEVSSPCQRHSLRASSSPSRCCRYTTKTLHAQSPATKRKARSSQQHAHATSRTSSSDRSGTPAATDTFCNSALLKERCCTPGSPRDSRAPERRLQRGRCSTVGNMEQCPCAVNRCASCCQPRRKSSAPRRACSARVDDSTDCPARHCHRRRSPAPTRAVARDCGSSRRCAMCRACGHPLQSADVKDVIARIAAGELEHLRRCPACGYVEGWEGHAAASQPKVCHPSEVPRDEKKSELQPNDANHGRASSAKKTTSFFHHRGASVMHTAHYGRKVYITDDDHLARRQRFMEEWEREGRVRRLFPTTRSPSAPLPERTMKWRTLSTA